MPPNRIASRPYAMTFADHLAAFGFRPKLRTDQHKIIGGPGAPLAVLATVTDNAVVNTDLRAASLWDLRVQQCYGSAATPIRGMLHLEGIALYVNDADYLTETAALKESLDNRAYVTITSNNSTQKIPLRSHIIEPFGYVDYKQATAANETRVVGVQSNGPLWLEKPFAIDLEADTFTFNVDTAIDFVSGNLSAYLLCYGAMCPKGTPGSDVTHTSATSYDPADDVGGAFTVASPLQLAQITAAWLQRTLGKR
jgi:hypothetical protein